MSDSTSHDLTESELDTERLQQMRQDKQRRKTTLLQLNSLTYVKNKLLRKALKVQEDKAGLERYMPDSRRCVDVSLFES